MISASGFIYGTDSEPHLRDLSTARVSFAASDETSSKEVTCTREAPRTPTPDKINQLAAIPRPPHFNSCPNHSRASSNVSCRCEMEPKCPTVLFLKRQVRQHTLSESEAPAVPTLRSKASHTVHAKRQRFEAVAGILRKSVRIGSCLKRARSQ